MNEPTPGLARRRQCIVSSERLRIGKDGGLQSARLGVFFRRLEGSARQGAPVDLFVLAAPPWRCPSLFVEDSHLRAAAVGASDDEVQK